MRNQSINKSIVVVAAVVVLLSITAMMSFSQAPAPAAGQGGGGRGGRGGGGAGAGAGGAAVAPGGVPAANTPGAGGGGGGQGGGGGRGGGAADGPTPRFADGTVNLGRSPGESTGIWGLPYITNMGAANVVVGAQAAAPAGGAGGGGRGGAGGGGGRGGNGGGGGRGGNGGAANPNPVPQVRGSAAQPWVPFQPWAAAFYDYNQANAMKYDPEGQCMPPGGPRMFATPYPMEIIQSPETKRIWMIFEGGTHVWREIHMDGRAHPANNTIKGLTWLGDSVGHWEGDTLVVDVVNFTEGTWLDYAGHPHTDQMHVIEKFTRPSKNVLHFEALIDDPGAYTKPWTVQWNINWTAGGELKEYICQENNLYLNHLKDDLGNSFVPH
ncbi:MAG TPA: hypothetical protein VK210_09570 [Terriglobia bacterium]|nr:hypothetical protein [Terriglobia bacterium]